MGVFHTKYIFLLFPEEELSNSYQINSFSHLLIINSTETSLRATKMDLTIPKLAITLKYRETLFIK